MRLAHFPSDFWVYSDPEKCLNHTFTPIFQQRIVCNRLALPETHSLQLPDLQCLAVILFSHFSPTGLQLQSKAHFMRFLPMLTRLETYPALHNLLMDILSAE